jgi:preprotein translocase subunit SecG
VVLVAAIILQSSKSGGLSGAIAGSSDSFMSKGGSKTIDAKLAKLTKWVGLAFVILSLFAVILVSATKNSSSANTDTPETTAAAVVTTGASVETTAAPVESTAPATTNAG